MAHILWHSCAPWAASGYGNQTAIWTRELQKMGHTVTVSTYWGIQGGATQWNGITILPGFGGNYCTQSLYQHAKMFQPDLIITLGDVWVMDPNLLKQLPVAHWLPVDCRPQSVADRNVLDQSGAELIAMSQFGFDRMRTAGYNPVYVPHAVDTDVFRPLENRDTIRESIGLRPEQFVIGLNQANNDAIRKAIPEQMLGFAKFADTHPDSMLTLHTGVHQEGGQDLEAVAENLGILDKVRVVDQYRYTSGMLTSDDLNEWYNVIDVLSQAVYAEGFGLPIVEAQAAGTPVITTMASSMDELNPYGLKVDGKPFWNGVHKGWWIAPDPGMYADALEASYQDWRDGSVDKVKLREFAESYEVSRVAEKYMGPAVDELLVRMKEKHS